MSPTMGDYLSSLFHTALHSVNGRTCVSRAIKARQLQAPDYVIAIGKAAAAMVAGVYDSFPSSLPQCLLIINADYLPSDFVIKPGCLVAPGGHPFPDSNTIEAGRLLLDFIGDMSPGTRVLCLLSGGASAMVEVLPAELNLEDLKRANEWLVASGLDIHEINAVRKALSLIKNGGLAACFGQQQVTGLVISDVPGDDLSIIGSGLLTPNNNPLSTSDFLPPWLVQMMNTGRDRLKSGPAEKPDVSVIANNRQACEAVVTQARNDGFSVNYRSELITGDAVQAGKTFARNLINQEQKILVQGGESTVKLPPQPGQGGRNQAFALAAATVISEHKPVWILSAGTDGRDGVTNHAGALVNHMTIRRGEALGLAVETHLREANTTPYLEVCGACLDMDYTGTNVMDIMIGYKD